MLKPEPEVLKYFPSVRKFYIVTAMNLFEKSCFSHTHPLDGASITKTFARLTKVPHV